MRGDLAEALDRLDAFADGLAFLLGHNLVAFDAVQLAAVRPGLAILKLLQVDTLRLNPRRSRATPITTWSSTIRRGSSSVDA